MKIKEPSELIKKIKNKITKNDIFSIITVFIFGLINNFNFIITEGIAPDALPVPDFNIASNWEISLGRFGIKYIDSMRFGLVNKLIIIIVCLLFIALSVLVIIRIFKIKSKIIIFLIATIISVAPQFTETYMFLYCADSYVLAFLISTLAVYFLTKIDIKKRNYLWTVICIAIVCSLYQVYLGVILGLTIIYLINELINNKNIKEVIIKSLKYLITIFVGILFYYITLKIIINNLGLSLASYKGANSLGLNTIKQMPKTIIQTYKDFYNFFFTNKIINNTYWNRININICIFLISSLAYIFTLIKGKYNNKLIRIVLLSLLLFIFPIGISIMDIIAPSTTINLVTGPGLITSIMLVVLIYNKLNNNSFENIIKYLLILLISILIVTFILENTFTYMCRQQTYKNYYTVLNDIYSKATNLDEYTTDKKWMFSDIIKYVAKDREKANGFISNNYETWGNYQGTLHNSNFYNKYLGIKIKMCSKKEYEEIINTEEFKNMPIYPNKGSISIINNIIVIKISEKTF